MAGANVSLQSPIRFILSYLLRKPVPLALAVCCTTINKIADILPEVLIGIAIDVVTGGGNKWLDGWGVTSPRTQLVILAGITIFIWVAESVFEFLYIVLWGRIAQRIQREVRVDAYHHIQKLPLSFFNTIRIGKLTSILNDDINEFEYILGAARDQGLSGMVQLCLSTVLIGSIFCYISPQIAFIAMLPIPFVAALGIFFRERISTAYGIVREMGSTIASVISHNIGGIMSIKGFGTEEYERKRVLKRSKDYERASVYAVYMNGMFAPLVRVFVLAGFVYTLIKGGMLVFDGHIAVGSYSMLIFLTQRLIWPFTGLSGILDSYERSMSSVRRLLEFLRMPIDQAYETPHLPDSHNESMSEGEVVFKEVSFGYNSTRPVLKKLSLVIPPQKTVAFVGQTGSGKSTIIKLLMRLYHVQKGTITVNGSPLNEMSLDSLRKSVGFVGQESFIVPDTVANNIRYGAFDLPIEQVKEAAKSAQIHDFILSLPEKYDTFIDESGKQLSGGQRQRVMLARALVRNPDVLILDEATSAVDNETELALSHMLRALQHSITIIMIAHRLTTVRHADIIFVLDKGLIVESGSHDQLLKKKGAYARLWRSQVGED
jgi:ATP-binding cassette subfamily B protein